MRIGVQLQPQHASYASIRQACATPEEIGVDVIFTWDHFYPLYGDARRRALRVLDRARRLGRGHRRGSRSARWSPATATATRTCSPTWPAPSTTSAPRTAPAVILGIGSGWFERDYDEYGYEFGTAGGRLDALDRDLPVIKARWAKLNPPPTRDIPVLIGGGGERKTLRIVAEQADIWHGFGAPETIAHKHAVLDEWCATVGRDPGEIERSAGVSPKPGRHPEDVADYAAGAEALYDVGTRLFTVGLSGPDYDLGPVRDLVAWRDARAV